MHLRTFFQALALPTFLLLGYAAGAAEGDKIKFDYHNEDLAKVVEDYAKASGQRFIIEPNVNGKITIINSQPVSLEEAFNELSTALAANNFGISTQGDVMNVMQARFLQRNMIPVVKEVPTAKPERMFTYVTTLKYISADEVNKQLRILTSRDGELVVFTPTNQLIISDWSTNLQRIDKILKELDQPGAKVAVTKAPPAKAGPEHKGAKPRPAAGG